MIRALYPGTFDPITNGHLDIIRRARRLFDELIVAVAKARHKDSVFDLDERVALVKETIDGYDNVKVIVGEVPAAQANALRGAIDWFRQKADSTAVLLACHDEGKVTLLAGMSRDVVGKGVKAGDLIKEVAPLVGGRGGGRPDMAQGGGSDPTAVSSALDRARDWLQEKLG